MTTLEARYYRATRGCHRAWAGSQPQYVIPGVLDAADAGAVRCVEPAAPPVGGLTTGDGTRLESPSGPTRPPYNSKGPDAASGKVARPGRKEATP